MTRHLLSVCTVLCVLLMCTAAGAEKDKSIPNLVGTWISVAPQCYHLKGLSKIQAEARITEQHGMFFKGTHTWKHIDESEAGMHAGGKHTTQATEQFIGVIGHDGKTIFIAEHGDTGIFHIRLVEPNMMEVLYVESGRAPAVCHEHWKRKP